MKRKKHAKNVKKKGNGRNKKTMNKVALPISIGIAVLAIIVAISVLIVNQQDRQELRRLQALAGTTEASMSLIPPLDLRGFPLDHFEVQQWFLERLNFHREEYGIHPYELHLAASLTSIEHSLDMRKHSFSRNTSSDGRGHQERHDKWLGVDRDVVTSSLVASHSFTGPVTRESIHEFVDSLFEREDRHSFIQNPIYHFIGIGFSVDEEGTGRVSFTFVSESGKREAHHAATAEERQAYREEYLERVRRERGWTPEGND